MNSEAKISDDATGAGVAPRRYLGLRISRALMLAALAAAALVSFVLIRAQQGSGSQIVQLQGTTQRLTASAVSGVVGIARSPAAHGAPRGAHCRRGSQGLLHDPWRCTIVYAAGQRIFWLIQILPSGHYVGVGQTVLDPGKPAQHIGGVITGCCIAIP